MVNVTVYDVLIKRITDDKNDLQQAIVDGAPKSYEEYKFYIGKLHGLATAENHILALKKHYEQSDED
jgi:hypothetical protein